MTGGTGRRVHARLRGTAIMIALVVAAAGAAGGNPFGSVPAARAAAPNLGRVALIDAGIGLLYVPANIAKAKGYFEQQGLDVEISVASTGAGTDATAAVIGGSAQFTDTGMAQITDAADQGSPLVAIAGSMTEYGVSIVITKDAAAKAGVTAASPLETRIKALKGLRIGISAPGSATDQFMRYVAKQAGLDPDHDMTLVALGSVGATRAAFAQRRIDGFIRSSPDPEAAAIQDNGMILLAQTGAGGLPSMRGFMMSVYATNKNLLTQHPEIVRAFMLGLTQGEKFLAANSDASSQIYKSLRGADIPADIWNAAWKSNYPAMAKDPVIGRHNVDVTFSVLKAIEGKAPSSSYDQVVNNSFAQQANALLKNWTP